MVSVEFTHVLKNFFPTLASQQLEARSLSEALEKLEVSYPGLSDYLMDETGRFREHISVYLDNDPLPRATSIHEGLKDGQQVFFFQAISGG